MPSPVLGTMLHLEGRPTPLFFNGKNGCWCEMRECAAADRSSASLPEGLLPKFIVKRLDVHEAKDVMREYRVMFPPAVILLSVEGNEVYRQEYGVYRETLIEEVESRPAWPLPSGWFRARRRWGTVLCPWERDTKSRGHG